MHHDQVPADGQDTSPDGLAEGGPVDGDWGDAFTVTPVAQSPADKATDKLVEKPRVPAIAKTREEQKVERAAKLAGGTH